MNPVEKTVLIDRIDELTRQCDKLFNDNQKLIDFICQIANDRDDRASPGLKTEAAALLMLAPGKAKR